ncbi:MAG: hypothetical protein R2769_14225 [Saprospiraceae bacterium]
MRDVLTNVFEFDKTRVLKQIFFQGDDEIGEGETAGLNSNRGGTYLWSSPVD